MKIFISALVAYLFSGISSVLKDLSASRVDRPMWARNPNLRKIFLFTLIWPLGPIFESQHYTGQTGRPIAFGTLRVVLQVTVLTALIYGSHELASYIFQNLFFQLITTAAIAFICLFFLSPIIGLLMIPITLLISWPLDLLFPLEKDKNAKQIK